MDVESPTGPFELCDVIDYHTVEIYNAQLGNIFDVVMEATLPLGLELVPNSSQIAYPTDDPFVNIPDPANIAGNVYQWDISATNDFIQNNGLLGISKDPGNSVSVRFLTTTDCGFVAGSQIIFKVIGKQNCDEPSNSLSKTGDQINIAGVNPQYSSDINIAITSSTSTSITYDANVPLNINILPDGATSNADTVLITLPPGVSYIPGSYIPINNASSTPPIIFNNGGQEILKIKIDANIPANSLISFEIETTGYGAIGCSDQVIQVQAVQRQDAVCTTTGELCYVLAATGSGTITISSEHPDFSLQSLDIVAYEDSINYEVSIINIGIPNSSDIQVDFYIDTDGDGELSTGDIFVSSGTYAGTVVTDETIILIGNMMLSANQLCNLIAVIDEDNNCICGTEAIPVTAPINSVLDDEFVYSGAALEIGIPTTNGHTYQWDPPGNISSTTNSMMTFQFSNTSSVTSYFDFTLIDNNNEGCEIHHNVEVTVIPVPGINQQDLEICEGGTVTISATAGDSYVWDGPNISNPNAPAQTVTLFENTTFTVTVTLPEGCEGMDEINIEVLPYESAISQLEKCPEETVILLGQQITEAGYYCDTISNVTGCDSLICVEVINYNSQTEITRALCQGDSIVIEGITYFEEQTICNTYTSLFGCDSTHCINIQLIPEPFAEVITTEIIAAQGEETQLEVTPGFEIYEWFPTTGLSCTDCHNPIATLTETTEYTVTLTDSDGCTTQLFLLVTVLPPCEAERLLIPNVFTPDGDGLNGQFGIVEYEGFEMVSFIKIFDRWGEKVYENSGVDPYWDGKIDGKPGSADVYIYILKIVCSDGEAILYGDVTLIR
jgi:gliding motility-associated-like protein